MRTVRTSEPEVFLIAQSKVNREQVDKWMKYLQLNSIEDNFSDLAIVKDPSLLVALAAKRCYMSQQVSGHNPNVTKVRNNIVEYLDNVLKQKHGSVLEHAVFTFVIEGVSRVFTAEMNRHRAGWAISEGSLRYIRFGQGIQYRKSMFLEGPDVLPASDLEVQLALLEAGAPTSLSRDEKKQLSRWIRQKAFEQQSRDYSLLELVWKDELSPESSMTLKKKLTSMLRDIIGLGVITGGVWTGNIRALRHVIALRTDSSAEEEICLVFSKVISIMQREAPELFGDFVFSDLGWKPRYEKV